MANRISRADILGTRFGRLTPLSELPIRITASGQPKRLWLCRCDCGETIEALLSNLRRGHTTSCGCFHRERTGDRHRTHGHSSGGVETDEFSIWMGMLDRCQNPNSPNWDRYGGRGIKVCERWQIFQNFYDDMGKRPSKGHSIDRYPDNGGDYMPGNCRWATRSEQQRNTSANHYEDFNGERLCLIEISERAKIDYCVLTSRLRSGKTIEQAIAHPFGVKRPDKMLTHNNETLSRADWGRRLGVTPQAINDRLKRGMSVAEALDTPFESRRADRLTKKRLVTIREDTRSLAEWAALKGLTLDLIRQRVIKLGRTLEEAILTPGPQRKPKA